MDNLYLHAPSYVRWSGLNCWILFYTHRRRGSTALYGAECAYSNHLRMQKFCCNPNIHILCQISSPIRWFFFPTLQQQWCDDMFIFNRPILVYCRYQTMNMLNRMRKMLDETIKAKSKTCNVGCTIINKWNTVNNLVRVLRILLFSLWPTWTTIC